MATGLRGLCALVASWPVLGLAVGKTLHAQGTNVPASAEIIQPTALIDSVLRADARHVYAVSLKQGRHVEISLEGTSREKAVGLKVFSPDSVVVGSISTWQREAGAPIFVQLAERSGEYRIVLNGAPEAPYRLRLRALGGHESAREDLALREAKAWLAANAHPLSRVEAGGDNADLAPLVGILRGVRVVALGEATHGSREFEQVKHRILEFLVQRAGFTHFGLETSADAARSINEYVMSGRGDRAALLANQAFWNWDTEEIASTIDWMRHYNSSVPEAKKIRFFGFDFQINPTAQSRIGGYIRRVAPERATPTDSLLAALTDPIDTLRRDFMRYYRLSPEQKKPIVAGVNELRGFLELNSAKFIASTSRGEFQEIIGAVQLLQQFADSHSRPGFAFDTANTGLTTRDRYMAENILGALRVLPPGAKLVVSMHNEHSRRDPHLYTVGHYLGEALGEAYYAFNLGFYEGGFHALNLAEQPLKVRPLKIGPGFPQSIDWFLNGAGIGPLYVDFRHAPRVGPAAEWLGKPRRMRSIGGGHPPQDPGYYRHPVIAGTSFDGVIFVPRTTPTRLNRTVTR